MSKLATTAKGGKSGSGKVKTNAQNISEQFICPITQELMVDPVIAEDERMYERSAITEWLMNHQTSPLDPSRTLSAAVLISNRAVREAIELLVDSGDIDEELRASWVERKRNYDMAKAQEMYAEGRVMDPVRVREQVFDGHLYRIQLWHI